MKRINEDIKSGNFRKLYLLCGQEAYLRIQYLNMLKDAMAGDDMNCNVYEGAGIDIPSLIDQSETLPFFADRRLIVIKDSGLLKEGGEQLADYIPTAPDTTFFVISEKDVDKRSKLYKTCQKIGMVVSMDTPDELTLKKWIGKLLSDAGKKITSADADHFLRTVGQDMFLIKNEAEKLIAYCGQKDIVTRADIDEICTEQINDRVFAMIDAISSKNQKKALNLYYDLLALKESPFRILSLIVRHFNILLQMKELLLKNAGKGEIVSKVPVPPFYVNDYINQTGRFNMKELIKALDACAETDASIKNGNLKDSLALEILITELSE
ncbi:MAG: DNA polymerase III subunit delta [Lachnospiraceae bacterium]|nr:DNA polymerase III subunit delta [Lachnospiraceae bacterium]